MVIVFCDGLKGLPDAIEATWPRCHRADLCRSPAAGLPPVRHLERPQGRRQRAAPVYGAVNAQAAEAALGEFEAGIGHKYPAVVSLWRNSWEQFTPFRDYPPEVRRVIYTTNRGGPQGTGTIGWKRCSNQLAVRYPGRLPLN